MVADSLAILCCTLAARSAAGDSLVGVGDIVGTTEGACVGESEGAPVGESVGETVGWGVVAGVGLKDGEKDGTKVGLADGAMVGLLPVHNGVQEPLLRPGAEFQYGTNDAYVVLMRGL